MRMRRFRSRSKSPFRRLSKSPQRGRKEEISPQHEMKKFRELCLDRPDDTGAIEVLLDTKQMPDTGRGPFGPKQTFLKRIFRTSPRKDEPMETSVLQSRAMNAVLPMSSAPKSPSTVNSTRMHQTQLQDESDAFSSISSLSGTRATFATPLRLKRHESLGTDSIRDVRVALQAMETQLGAASSKGERISRQKVMKALFTVADSLEERDELHSMMHNRSLLDAVAEGDESSEDSSQKENEPVGFMASVSRMFSISKAEKKRVDQALDDLLWTEFVSARNVKKRPAATKQSTWWQTSSSPPPKMDVVEEEEDEDSYWSDDEPSNLPTTINVKTIHRSAVKQEQTLNSTRYQVNMVDTESHYGYEMATP